MSTRTRTHTQPAECVEYFGKDGVMIGAVISYRRFGRTIFVVEARDWENDEIAADGYASLIVDVSDDPDGGVKEMESRARTYGAL